MRIVFAISGTRGDIQPAALLAHALAQRGHDVVMGVPPNFFELLDKYDISVKKLGYDTREYLDALSSARAGTKGHPLRRMRVLLEMKDNGWSEFVDDMSGLVAGADVIVSGFVAEQVALIFAEKFGIPIISLHHAPIRANSTVGPIPAIDSGRRATILQWNLIEILVGILTIRRENTLRRSLNMPTVIRPLATRMKNARGSEIQAYDPVFAVGGSRWRQDSLIRPRPVVGFIDTEQAPGIESNPELSQWIRSGTEPVYLGFGSMPIRDQRTVAGLIRTALSLGRRVLLCAGWNDIDDQSPLRQTIRDERVDSERIRVERMVQHSAVFPHCAAIIHHGGAGTTAAALRAGRPALICWYGSDQPFWGRELARHGAAVTISVNRAQEEQLDAALRSVLHPDMTARAVELQQKMISSENAIGESVNIIESAG